MLFYDGFNIFQYRRVYYLSLGFIGVFVKGDGMGWEIVVASWDNREMFM